MSEELDVLYIVKGLEGCAALVHLLDVLGFVRINSLQDAEPSA